VPGGPKHPLGVSQKCVTTTPQRDRNRSVAFGESTFSTAGLLPKHKSLNGSYISRERVAAVCRERWVGCLSLVLCRSCFVTHSRGRYRWFANKNYIRIRVNRNELQPSPMEMYIRDRSSIPGPQPCPGDRNGRSVSLRSA
jgi:hypothetical protein